MSVRPKLCPQSSSKDRSDITTVQGGNQSIVDLDSNACRRGIPGTGLGNKAEQVQAFLGHAQKVQDPRLFQHDTLTAFYHVNPRRARRHLLLRPQIGKPPSCQLLCFSFCLSALSTLALPELSSLAKEGEGKAGNPRPFTPSQPVSLPIPCSSLARSPTSSRKKERPVSLIPAASTEKAN